MILPEAAIMADMVVSCIIQPNALVTRFFFGHGGGKMIVVSATDDCNKIVGVKEDGEVIMTY